MSKFFTNFAVLNNNKHQQTMMADIVTEENEQKIDKVAQRGHALAWVSLVLALLSWVALMLADGYVSLVIGLVAIVVGFLATARNERMLRKIAITSIIVATVLVVVVTAFLIAINIVLSVV